MKTLIIVGGGYSVKEGIELGLWDHIKGYTIWSLNYAYKSMPYLPTRQLWVDYKFCLENSEDIKKLWENGVEIVIKHNTRYAEFDKKFAEQITQYQTTRERSAYKGPEVLKDLTPFIFAGRMGLVGIFALTIATAEKFDQIYLLGYDWGTTNINDNLTHFYQEKFGVYRGSEKKQDGKIYSTGIGNPIIYRQKNNTVKKDVKDFEVFKQSQAEIINVSLISNIEYFPKISYPEFFERI